MPRIRSLKPEIWTDEALGAVPIGARLLYIGLITQADDAGRFKSASALVRSQVFPYDESLSTRRVSEWLDALAESSLIIRYTVKGESYGCFPSWDRHQKIDKPSMSKLPSFEDADLALQAGTQVDSPNTRRTLADASPLDQGSRIKEEERIKDQGSLTARGARGICEELLEHWKAQPGMIQHKRVTDVMTTAAKKALKSHDLAEIKEAIELYATVLTSSAHYWTHQWTLDEFLTRGVDKFTPDTQPLTRYFGETRNGDKPAASHQQRAEDVEAKTVASCRERYDALVDAGADPAEARLEVAGSYNDRILELAITREPAA